jgi:hypothetical protein
MIQYFTNRLGALSLAAGCVTLLGLTEMPSAIAQPPIFSFEEPADLDPWLLGSTQTLVRSSFGATHGSSALLIENLTSGFKGNIATTPNFSATTPGLSEAFQAFDLAAKVIAGGGTPRLEFDLAWDFSGGSIPEAGGYIQLGLFVNSSTAGGGGFKQYGTGSFIGSNTFDQWPSLGTVALDDGVTLTSTGPTSTRVSIPFGPTKRLSLSSTSTFFDIGLQSNGVWNGSVDFAIDNIKFTGVPIFEEHTLFSWETPDNPATPAVNEQFEGWTSAVTPATQNLSITSTGATDGSFALQLDRTPQPSGFTWGSVFGLDATVDPSVQSTIDDFVTRINGASRIAIDITYEDQFPISPSFSQLWLALTDESGNYYQAGSANFDITAATNPRTQTLIFELASFVDNGDPQNLIYLSEVGLQEGTNQFAIVLGTSTNGGAVYQIDNFRLISEVVDTIPGDFDNDGDVDGRDFLVWQRGGSPNPLSAGDLAEWQAAYNGGALSAVVASVPEPSAIWLALMGTVVVIARKTRS